MVRTVLQTTIAAPFTAGMAIALAVSTAALAQTPVQPQPTDPNMPAQQNTVPEKIEPGTTGSAPGTLSDKLNRSGGVITPPANVDPGIATPAPVPNPGSTPVIRPPGTSGGDTVQPK